MLTFLAILILMGIVHKPRLPMYWSTDSILATPIFSQVMRRDRFLLLFRFLHFADNTKYSPADPDRDKIYKIREVINMIKDRCGKVYSPGKSLSMNESLVLFKARWVSSSTSSPRGQDLKSSFINSAHSMVYFWISLCIMETWNQD